MEEKELEQVSEFNNSEKEVAKFRQEVPIEVLENKRLRRAFGIRIPPRKLFPKIGRNELCPCNSGKKFKKCCIEDYDREYLYKQD